MQGFAAFSPWQLFGSRSGLWFGGKIRAGGRPFCSLRRQLEEMGALASLRVLSRRQGLISIQLYCLVLMCVVASSSAATRPRASTGYTEISWFSSNCITSW